MDQSDMDKPDMDFGMDRIETFWGAKLSKTDKVFEWDGAEEEEEGIESTLELRGACLGVDDNMAANERNVIAVTVEGDDGDEEQFVIASLRLEHTEQVPLLLQLKPPVKLELLKGSGPVHVTGVMTSALSMSDMEDEDDDSEEEQAAVVQKPKLSILKRPAAESPTKKPSKMARTEASEEDEEEDSRDLSMEEKSMDKSLDDAEDDDDEITGESEDEESDEGDDLSEEEEEEMSPPKKTKAKTSKAPPEGKKPNKSPGASKTPQPIKPLKPAIKTPLSVQNNKSSKTATPNKGHLTIDQLKKKLSQTGNIPKKLEKFNNYMTNTFKVTDDGVKKQLWEFVQKNRK